MASVPRLIANRAPEPQLPVFAADHRRTANVRVLAPVHKCLWVSTLPMRIRARRGRLVTETPESAGYVAVDAVKVEMDRPLPLHGLRCLPSRTRRHGRRRGTKRPDERCRFPG